MVLIITSYYVSWASCFSTITKSLPVCDSWLLDSVSVEEESSEHLFTKYMHTYFNNNNNHTNNIILLKHYFQTENAC